MVKFQLGQTVATPGALDAMNEAGQNSYVLLTRHVSGDWGDLDHQDKRTNDEALVYGNRVLSAYVLSTGVKVWIITEADRSATTFLLPSEY